MKSKLCGIVLRHSLIKEKTVDVPGGFRFVLQCPCKAKSQTSIVLTDNDLQADINLHSRSFPVETDKAKA